MLRIQCPPSTKRHTRCEADLKQVTEQFGLAGSAALIYENGEQIHGLPYAELLDIAEAADLLVNITGHLTLEPLMSRLRRKVYLDLDPGFTQFWHASKNAGPRLGGYDLYFTVGENIGTRFCPIPTGGIRWRPTRQPVVLDHWPVSGGATAAASRRSPRGAGRMDRSSMAARPSARRFTSSGSSSRCPSGCRRSSRSPWTFTRTSEVT